MKGEFEKRIVHYRKQHNSVKIQRKKYVRTTLNAIQADIVEARKEWPTRKKVHKILWRHKGSRYDELLNDKRLDWFLKWFGAKEVSK